MFLRVPHLKIRTPRLSAPPPMAIFGIALLSYFLVSSGIIYDIIMEPPGIGQSQDPVTGAVKPVAFLPYRINGQYIIEGLSAGFLFTLGGIGLILLDGSVDKTQTRGNRLMLAISGAVCTGVAYQVCLVFLRMKIPNYMKAE
eukprot:jgi/Mesvir1/7110/Mv09213-RA.1